MAGGGCTSRPERYTGCWTRSRLLTRAWRSSPAPPAVLGSTSGGWNGPIGCGSRTASTRWSASPCARWTTQLIPPELMGAHVASGRSHTTGRVHDLDFRAATAVFGHLGIEWDLAKAAPEELEQLRAWIELVKQHRELLLGGDLIRMQLPDLSLDLHGVVAADRSRGHLRGHRGRAFGGGVLGPAPVRRPRPAAALSGHSSDDRLPTDWAQAAVVVGCRTGAGRSVRRARRRQPVRYRVRDGGQLGIELPGGRLMEVGLAAAVVHPEHTVLYHLVAVD
jgi:alpha-galactosidase